MRVSARRNAELLFYTRVCLMDKYFFATPMILLKYLNVLCPVHHQRPLRYTAN